MPFLVGTWHHTFSVVVWKQNTTDYHCFITDIATREFYIFNEDVMFALFVKVKTIIFKKKMIKCIK